MDKDTLFMIVWFVVKNWLELKHVNGHNRW